MLLQQFDGVLLSTFGDISEFLLKRILNSGAGTIYFATDQYLLNSVKEYEMSKKSADGSLCVCVERGQIRGNCLN